MRHPLRRLLVLPLAIFFVCHLFVASAPANEAGSMDALLNVLVKKGILNIEDVSGIKAEVAAEMAQKPEAFERGQNLLKSFTGEKFSVGAGIRTSLKVLEDGAPDVDGFSYNGNLENIRLYTNGQMTEHFGVEFNTEIDTGNASAVRVLDAILKYKLNDSFQVWLGRHLPPSDRSNLDGPFYLNTFEFPGLVSRYPAIFAGRDDGISIHGELLDEGRLGYVVGAFKGLSTAPNNSANLLYAGRVTYNFWDPEPAPWYYTGSTYYGDADILALGIVGQWQQDGVASTGGNFRGANIDLLMEKKIESLGDGVLTLESAVYTYDFDEVSPDGEAYLAYVGFLFPDEIGPGKFQPHVRWQSFGKSFEADSSQLDIGLNYVMQGHNGRLSLVYSLIDSDALNTDNQVLLGAQFQV